MVNFRYIKQLAALLMLAAGALSAGSAWAQDEAADVFVKRMSTEVLDVIKELATQGITMLCVTHEMGFARSVADRVIFMDHGQIVEENTPDEFFNNPKNERTRDFLSKILSH